MVTIGMDFVNHRVVFHSIMTIGLKVPPCTSLCQHFSKKQIKTDKDGLIQIGFVCLH